MNVVKMFSIDYNKIRSINNLYSQNLKKLLTFKLLTFEETCDNIKMEINLFNNLMGDEQKSKGMWQQMRYHRYIQNSLYKYGGHSALGLFCSFSIILDFKSDTSHSI